MFARAFASTRLAAKGAQPARLSPAAGLRSKFDRPLVEDAHTPTTSDGGGRPISTVESILQGGAKLVEGAQALWSTILRPGDICVDATCGNGHDTLFLAKCVGKTGAVYAFDIQQSACEATRERLASQLDASVAPQTLQVIQECHSTMQEHVGSNKARLIVFNLGYLPAGDKSIITKSSSTLAAVEAALEVVGSGGFVSIMCYVGHPGGMEEYQQVKGLLEGLPGAFWVTSETRLLNRRLSPIWLQVWRR